MFENDSNYSLKKNLERQMSMNGTPLNGWVWEDQASHHMKHNNLAAVDILNAAINRRAELKAQREARK